MGEEDFEFHETKCIECGKSDFRLTRRSEHQILAECIHCGYPHTLDSAIDNKKHSALLHWFTTQKVSERCVECRAPLKIHDIDVQTRRARAQCEQCGLLHIYKKNRLLGWRMIRITRQISHPLSGEDSPESESDPS